MQADIIPAIDRSLIEQELKKVHFLRKTNNANNEIYVATHFEAPNILREIGRLRELSFRMAGGGTGLECDLDVYDLAEVPYKQLFVWDPLEKEIVGGYRYILGHEVKIDDKGVPCLATSGLLRYSDKFIYDYLPYTIELGRSFVQPMYQPSRESRRGLFSLDNLWDGLGALVVDHPDIRYFFGKVTMYDHFDAQARDMILYFLNTFFPDTEKLVEPLEPLAYKTDVSAFKDLFNGANFDENHKILFQQVRARSENIPPLVNSYMSLSPSMRTFGTAKNREFGEVEETGILITIADIYESKTNRHIKTYIKP